MALTITASGTVDNGDLDSMTITRTPEGVLMASVSYRVTAFGESRLRTASWALSTAERNTVLSSLLPGAKSAIKTDLGV